MAFRSPPAKWSPASGWIENGAFRQAADTAEADWWNDDAVRGSLNTLRRAWFGQRIVPVEIEVPAVMAKEAMVNGINCRRFIVLTAAQAN